MEKEKKSDSFTPPGSYADKAKTQKRYWPYGLYIHKVHEQRESLSKHVFKLFEGLLWDEHEKFSGEEYDRIKIEYIVHERDLGIGK